MVDYQDVLRALSKLDGELATHNPAHPLLFKLFGPRYSKALEIALEGGVKKYVFRPSGRILWIVVGRQREYLIYEKVAYCSCDDFYFAIMDGKALVCQHLIAQRLAEKLGWYDTVEEEDGLFDSLMKDWRGIPVVRDRAPTPASCQSSSKCGLTNSGEVNSNGDDVK